MKIAFVCLGFWQAAEAANALQKTGGAIGDVVKLLEDMLSKSEDDGASSREAYAKFKCYCDKNKKEKNEDIDENSEKVTLLENKIGKLQGVNGELSVDVGKLRADMDANEAKRDEAETIRKKEHESFVEEELDLTAAIGQMEEAIQTLSEIGADQASSEIQTGWESLLTKRAPKLGKSVKQALIAANTFLTPAQRSKVTSFLQKAPFTGTYTAQSGQVVGILKSMKDTFESNLEESKANEEKQSEAHDELMGTLTDAYDKMKEVYDEKEEELGSNDGDLSTKKDQLDDARTTVEDATEFLDKLLPMCDTKEKQYNVRKILRAGEETAVAKAISILKSEKAGGAEDMESGKFVQVAKSFLQVSSVSKVAATRSAAERILKHARDVHKSKRLGRVLAFLDAGNPFNQVLKQIAKTLELIKEEAKVDKEQKDWCISEREEKDETIAGHVGDITSLTDDIDGLDAKIDDPKTGLKQQIKDTNDDIDENRENQVDETAARRDENLAYQKDIKTIVEAEEALQKAVDVLTEFYKSLEDHNDAGDDEMLLQTKKKSKEDPAAPDAGMDEDFEGQSSKGNEVLDTLKEIKENTHGQQTRAHEDEEQAQHDYEDSMKGLTDDEAELKKTLTDLEKELADSELELAAKHDERDETEKEKMKVEQYVAKIKPGCDFVVDNFDDRESNRDTEKTALQKVIGMLEDSPAYKAAKTEADQKAMGDCKDTCVEDEAHANCKACLTGISVPGYCAGHPDVSGC